MYNFIHMFVFNLELKRKDDKHSVTFSHQVIAICKEAILKSKILLIEIIKRFLSSYFLKSDSR